MSAEILALLAGGAPADAPTAAQLSQLVGPDRDVWDPEVGAPADDVRAIVTRVESFAYKGGKLLPDALCAIVQLLARVAETATGLDWLLRAGGEDIIVKVGTAASPCGESYPSGAAPPPARTARGSP